MTTVALVTALGALGLALAAWMRAAGQAALMEDLRREVRRHAGAVEETLTAEIDVTRRVVERVARGEAMTSAQILDGQLWSEVDADAARALVESGDVAVIDLRTPPEIVSGVLEGARHIPMDELEERRDEIPRDRPALLYCSGGSRSAVACDALAREGWAHLINLEGGLGAWSGPVVPPTDRVPHQA